MHMTAADGRLQAATSLREMSIGTFLVIGAVVFVVAIVGFLLLRTSRQKR